MLSNNTYPALVCRWQVVEGTCLGSTVHFTPCIISISETYSCMKGLPALLRPPVLAEQYYACPLALQPGPCFILVEVSLWTMVLYVVSHLQQADMSICTAQSSAQDEACNVSMEPFYCMRAIQAGDAWCGLQVAAVNSRSLALMHRYCSYWLLLGACSVRANCESALIPTFSISFCHRRISS